MFYSFVTKHACDRRTDRQTDRQTDGQNYYPQDRASIAALRGKNESNRMSRAGQQGYNTEALTFAPKLITIIQLKITNINHSNCSHCRPKQHPVTGRTGVCPLLTNGQHAAYFICRPTPYINTSLDLYMKTIVVKTWILK